METSATLVFVDSRGNVVVAILENNVTVDSHEVDFVVKKNMNCCKVLDRRKDRSKLGCMGLIGYSVD